MDYYQNSNNEQVQAMLLTPELVTVVSVWSNAKVTEEIDPFSGDRYPALNVQCGDEVKRASLGYYVIKKSDGIFDVAGPMAFLHEYRTVN